jgi:hypothetical protein
MDRVDVVCGQRVPEMGGFTFRSPEEPEPSCDVTLSGPAGHPRAYALLLDDVEGSGPPAMTWTASDRGVNVEISGLTESTLTLRIGEGSVALGNPDRDRGPLA